MQQLQRGDQTISFDRERTEEVYASVQTGDAERCGCEACLYFASLRGAAYPKYFLALLEEIGIDPNKEGEAYECGPERDHIIYGGWFYFAGELLVTGERLVSDPDSGFQYWFGDGNHVPRPPCDFGPKLAVLEFIAKLPQRRVER